MAAPQPPGVQAAVGFALMHRPPLWIAASDGRVPDVRLLLADANVLVNEKGGPFQTTALSQASVSAHLDTGAGTHLVQVLLEHGADATSRDIEGQTALHLVGQGKTDHAASYGCSLVAMMLLLEYGADASAVAANTGSTPLHFAAHKGEVEMVLLLVNAGADVNVDTHVTGWTVLMFAVTGVERFVHLGGDAEARSHAVVRLLMHLGADLKAKTAYEDAGAEGGDTAEDIARQMGRHHTAAMLRGEAERREGIRRVRCEAFAMGHQERLGAGSRVRCLDTGVLQMVLGQM